MVVVVVVVVWEVPAFVEEICSVLKPDDVPFTRCFALTWDCRLLAPSVAGYLQEGRSSSGWNRQ